MSYTYCENCEEPLNDLEWVPVSVKPCPICGKIDGLFIKPENFYTGLVEEHGRACLNMGCKRCNLEVKVYGHEEIQKDYRYMRGRLIQKWNTREEV